MARRRTQIQNEIDPLEELDLDIVDAVKTGIKEGSAKGAKEGATKGFKEATAEKYGELARRIASESLSGNQNDPLAKQINDIEKLNQLEMLKATSEMIRGSSRRDASGEGQDAFQMLQLYLLSATPEEKAIAQTYLTQGYKAKEILGILSAMKQMGMAPKGDEGITTSHDAVKKASESSGMDMAEQMRQMIQMKMMDRMMRNQDDAPKTQSDNGQMELMKMMLGMMLKQQQPQQQQQGNGNMEMITLLMKTMQESQRAIEEARKESSQLQQEMLYKQIIPQLRQPSLVDELAQVKDTLGSLGDLGIFNLNGGRQLSDRELEIQAKRDALLLEMRREEMRMQQDREREAVRAQETQTMISQLLPLGAELLKGLREVGKNKPTEAEMRQRIQSKVLAKAELEGDLDES